MPLKHRLVVASLGRALLISHACLHGLSVEVVAGVVPSMPARRSTATLTDSLRRVRAEMNRADDGGPGWPLTSRHSPHFGSAADRRPILRGFEVSTPLGTRSTPRVRPAGTRQGLPRLGGLQVPRGRTPRRHCPAPRRRASRFPVRRLLCPTSPDGPAGPGRVLAAEITYVELNAAGRMRYPSGSVCAWHGNRSATLER